MAVVWLARIEQHLHVDAALVRRRQREQHIGIGEGVDLGPDADPCGSERGRKQMPDLLTWRGLGNTRRRVGWHQSRLTARQRPVLFEDPHQPVDLDCVAGLEHVVVIAIAVRTPVHAADDGFVIGDEELHVVDLPRRVVDWIEACGDARSLQHIERDATRVDRRIGDHTHVGTTQSIACKPTHDVATAELVHLDIDALFRVGDQAADQLKDGRVLPEPYGLCHLSSHSRHRHRRRKRSRARAAHEA